MNSCFSQTTLRHVFMTVWHSYFTQLYCGHTVGQQQQRMAPQYLAWTGETHISASRSIAEIDNPNTFFILHPPWTWTRLPISSRNTNRQILKLIFGKIYNFPWSKTGNLYIFLSENNLPICIIHRLLTNSTTLSKF